MKKHSILYIDSSKISYILVSEALSESDVNVVHAKTGTEAIDLFKKNPFFDMVITELILPDTDGLIVLDEIRKINSKIPVIVHTVYVTDNIRHKCLEKGFNYFFNKPIAVKEFIIEVERFLNHKSVKDENFIYKTPGNNAKEENEAILKVLFNDDGLN